MKILTSDIKVRATEFLLITRGAKAAIVRLGRCCARIRSSYYDTGKTGVPITTDRENEIDRAPPRLRPVEQHELTTAVHNEDQMKNFANENLENELRELAMSALATTDAHPRL